MKSPFPKALRATPSPFPASAMQMTPGTVMPAQRSPGLLQTPVTGSTHPEVSPGNSQYSDQLKAYLQGGNY